MSKAAVEKQNIPMSLDNQAYFFNTNTCRGIPVFLFSIIWMHFTFRTICRRKEVNGIYVLNMKEDNLWN